MNRVKPLWIVYSAHWDLAEQMALSDIVSLTQAEIPVHLFCLEGSPTHAAALRHPHLKITSFPLTNIHFFNHHFIKKLREVLINERINLVHLNEEDNLKEVFFSLYGFSKIAFVYSQYYTFSKRNLFSLFPIYLRRAHRILLSNQKIQVHTLDRFLISRNKFEIVAPGVDSSRFDPAHSQGTQLRIQWGADKDTIVIGTIGKLAPDMMQDVFLKAAAGLLKYTDRKMKFVIVDEEPLVAVEEYVQELNNLVKIFRMEEVVTFSTLGDNLPDVLYAFDVFVMCGTSEAFSLRALEALSMERPVLLPKSFGNSTILGNNQFGFNIKTRDAFDLQQKILILLNNPSQRLAMGLAGRKQILQNFDKKKRLEKLLEIYGQVLS